MKASALTIQSNDHILGKAKAKITLIQYADFQCPFSAAAAPLIRKTVREFGDDMCFVFRNFPLIHLHPFAFIASFVAEAAGEQGKFWQAHDLLFLNQRKFSPDAISDYFDLLELQPETFESSLKSKKLMNKIRNDQLSGANLSVKKTPSFFLNGQFYQNEWHESAMKHQIEKILTN